MSQPITIPSEILKNVIQLCFPNMGSQRTEKKIMTDIWKRKMKLKARRTPPKTNCLLPKIRLVPKRKKVMPKFSAVVRAWKKGRNHRVKSV